MPSDTRTTPRSPSIRYLSLGDSFTIGTGISAAEAFPAGLVRRWAARGIAADLTNPAVNGYTTDDLIDRELPLVATVRPTLVTLLIGANDIVRGREEDHYRAQLRRIHDALGAAGVAAADVVALPQPDWSISPAARPFGEPGATRTKIERFNAITREEAERAGSRYVDLFPLMRRQAEAGLLAADRLHPSTVAHAEWAAALDDLLEARPRG